MRRKTIALLLALTMCLSLLSACGGDSAQNTGEPTASGSAPGTTGQQPDEKDEQPSQKPEQTEPDESEEPTQEPEENAGTKLLALLQDEWQNGFYKGEGPKHTYFPLRNNEVAAIDDGVVYIQAGWGNGGYMSFISYNIATKESNEFDFIINNSHKWPDLFMDGCFWRIDGYQILKMDSNGTELKSIKPAVENSKLLDRMWFEKGFLYNFADKSLFVPYDLEKTVEIPVPQYDVEHGLKEDVNLRNCRLFVADGTVYLFYPYNPNDFVYRLNTDTCEWEAVELPVTDDFNRRSSTTPFCGKYVIYDNSIYDWLTGERVFDWREANVYAPVCANQYKDDYLCYFGGDQYLGYNGSEFRWVNLKDLTMSDPLPFPKIIFNNSDHMVILTDTYSVYYDQYGVFLWNYNTGEEEAIMLFNQ